MSRYFLNIDFRSATSHSFDLLIQNETTFILHTYSGGNETDLLKGPCMFGSRNTQVYALPPCYKLIRQQLT